MPEELIGPCGRLLTFAWASLHLSCLPCLHAPPTTQEHGILHKQQFARPGFCTVLHESNILTPLKTTRAHGRTVKEWKGGGGGVPEGCRLLLGLLVRFKAGKAYPSSAIVSLVDLLFLSTRKSEQDNLLEKQLTHGLSFCMLCLHRLFLCARALQRFRDLRHPLQGMHVLGANTAHGPPEDGSLFAKPVFCICRIDAPPPRVRVRCKGETRGIPGELGSQSPSSQVLPAGSSSRFRREVALLGRLLMKSP